ncbi:MAG: (d)CMP kinase [Bacteroidales bacterium]|nr:(d)CMP kinase [Bacteroidales bacterium]
MEEKLIIAIDGYSSCVKSTFAKLIAKELNYIFIDSGAMYRAATLFFIRKEYASPQHINYDAIIEDIDLVDVTFKKDEQTGIQETYLNGENVESEIRGLEVSNLVSQISAIKEVREKMVELQRSIGKDRGIVMDGRDIGTVVFPDADIKIFMTASTDVRAKRRYDEMLAKGVKVDIEEIRKNIMARDITDENREISPLRRAGDAIILDNSRMSIKKEMAWFRDLLKTRLSEK